MGSNFLGDIGEDGSLHGSVRSGIVSANELLAREGVDLHKGMNFRVEPLLSVFLVLPSHGGEYRDGWDEERQLYVFEGHDSTTVESGKADDQLMMYESGKLTDNGKFYKEAMAFKDGTAETSSFRHFPQSHQGAIDPSFAGRPLRAGSRPLQIQIYEKLEAGAWYDKGIFNLADAEHVTEDGRKIFKFYLQLADAGTSRTDAYRIERLVPVREKVAAWTKYGGRCAVCGSQKELYFVGSPAALRCALHRG